MTTTENGWAVESATGDSIASGLDQISAVLRARELRARRITAYAVPPEGDIECEFDVVGARPTDTGVDGAVDVEVTITFGEDSIPAEVTLVRDPMGGWSAWGSLDNWVDGDSVSWIELYPSDVKDQIVSGLERAAAIGANRMCG